MFDTSYAEICIENCTNEKNIKEDWSLISETCEAINKESPRFCVDLLCSRLFNPNPHVQKQAVTLLDACLKNCTVLFQNEVFSGSVFRRECKKRLPNMHNVNRTELLKRMYRWHKYTKNSPTAKQNIRNLVDFVTTPEMKREIKLFKQESKLNSNPALPNAEMQEKADLEAAIKASLLETNNREAFNKSDYHLETVVLQKTESEKKLKALYDFEAAEENELTFYAGETIILLDSSDANWWKGRNHRGEGLFPSSFVTSDVASTYPSAITNNTQPAEAPEMELKQSFQQLVIKPPVPKIDEVQLNQCLELLNNADPTADRDPNEELSLLEEKCHQMSGLIDEELQKIDKEHNHLCDINQLLLDAFNMYSSLMEGPQFDAAMSGQGIPSQYVPGSNVQSDQMVMPSMVPGPPSQVSIHQQPNLATMVPNPYLSQQQQINNNQAPYYG